MSLKLSQRTVESTALGYDQIQAEKTVSQSQQKETGIQMTEGRQDRSFVNTSEENGEQTTESRQDRSLTNTSDETGEQTTEGRQDRALINTSKVSRNSTQKANIGMRISFTIPLTGTVPISGPGGGGCA